MIAINPNTSSLYNLRNLIWFRGYQLLYSSSQFIKGIIAYRNDFLSGFESSDPNHWTENFFLKDGHIIMPFQNSVLDII